MNYCEWKLPDGQKFTIDVNTDVNSYIWGSIKYVGYRIPNCDVGNCIKSCDIKITDAKKSTHRGEWTCTSVVKVDYGKYVDKTNITFDGGVISKLKV